VASALEAASHPDLRSPPIADGLAGCNTDRTQVGVLDAHTYIEGPFDLGGEYIGVLCGGIAYRCHVDEFVESAGLVPTA
jgi:hypothetical protein